MGTDTADGVGTTLNTCSFKVHRSMCMELMKLVAKISGLLPEIEAARPRCSSGIRVLSLLNHGIEKANRLLQYCTESSKLYLALTSDHILPRFRRVKDGLEQNLYEIQNMVPVLLAVKISQLVDDLRNATLCLDSSEEEAGKVMHQLIFQSAAASESLEISELKALQLALLKLNIVSSKELVMEKRSIKNLLDKVDGNNKKRKILSYLIYLLNKYGKVIMKEQKGRAPQHETSFEPERSGFHSSDCQTVEVESHPETLQDEVPTNLFHGDMPPEEFKCPLSFRVMYDPVVIASGQTFERIWIQKWFEERNDTCPKTKRKLDHLSLTPNTTLKDLIQKWCMKYGVPVTDPSVQPATNHSWQNSLSSIASFASSMNDLQLQVNLSNISFGSLEISDSHPQTPSRFGLATINGDDNGFTSQVDADIGQKSTELQVDADIGQKSTELLHELSRLPWESQCQIVEDFKYDDKPWQDLSSEDYIKLLVGFLREAHDRHDIKAQRAGSEVLLESLRKNGSEISYLNEDAISLLISLMDSDISGEVLSLLEFLSSHENCLSKIGMSEAIGSILKILNSEKRDLHEAAMKFLHNLSTESDICSNIISTGCFSKLISLLDDDTLAGYSLMILRTLCEREEVRAAIAETKGCIASIAVILEHGTPKNQEHAIAILLCLCSQSTRYCHLVMNEGVFPTLFMIKVNGTEKGGIYATELIRVLGDIKHTDQQECLQPNISATSEPERQVEGKKVPSKSPGFIGRIRFW